MGAGRPEDIYLGGLGVAQAEMYAPVGGGFVASSRGGESCLPVYLNACPQSVAVAARAVQRNRQPVKPSATVPKHLRRLSENRGDHINPPVIIQIAESGASPRHQGVGPRIDRFKAAIVIHRQ